MLVSRRVTFQHIHPKKTNIEAENDALEYDFHLLSGCLVRFQHPHHPKKLDLELSGSGHLLLKHQNRIAMHYQSSYHMFFNLAKFLKTVCNLDVS